MDYLFFDIEASEGKSMCSFGYVITDENFRILEKKDILMNPEAKFCTQAWNKEKRRKGRGITLAYPESVFVSKPNFRHYYGEIEKVIHRPDTTVIGFSHANDARYLKNACQRYGMPFYAYRFFDVQDAYREYKKVPDQVALEKIIAELGVDIGGYTLHKSDDDAEISMLVAKAICGELNCSMAELIRKFSRFVGETKDGKIIYNGIDSERSAVRKMRKACQSAVIAYAKTVRKSKTRGMLRGKKFCADSAFEKDRWSDALKLVRILADSGAQYVGNIEEADYFIKFGESRSDSTRDRLYRAEHFSEKKIKIVSFDETLQLLDKTEEDFKAFSVPEIEKIGNRIRVTMENIDKDVGKTERDAES